MALNVKQIEAAKPGEKIVKLSDSGGLFLHVQTSGSKHWRMKYRFAGKETLLTFGPYPLVTIAEAREKRDAAKKQLLDGLDASRRRSQSSPPRARHGRPSALLPMSIWNA